VESFERSVGDEQAAHAWAARGRGVEQRVVGDLKLGLDDGGEAEKGFGPDGRVGIHLPLVFGFDRVALVGMEPFSDLVQDGM
jgi:hypothetical protein